MDIQNISLDALDFAKHSGVVDEKPILNPTPHSKTLYPINPNIPLCIKLPKLTNLGESQFLPE
jgi:hypothetical protein